VILLNSNGYHFSKTSGSQNNSSDRCLYHQRLANHVNKTTVYDLKALASSPSSLKLAKDDSEENAFQYLETKIFKIAKLLGVNADRIFHDERNQSAQSINKLLDKIIDSYTKPSLQEAQLWLNSNKAEEIILKKLEYLDQKVVNFFYTDKNTAEQLIYRDDLYPANLKLEKSLQCANKILKTLEAQSYYNLPLESSPGKDQGKKILSSSDAYFIPETINTKALINESLNYNQGRVETVINPRNKKAIELKSGLHSTKLNELLKSIFKVENNQMLKRDSGFEDSLRLYLNNMASYQPTMFKYCYEAAQHLTNIQKPIKNICTITAHQSESNLAEMMKLLQEQDFNKKDLTTFIFINGDSKDEINKRISELNKFQEKNPELDIRVFGGLIPKGEWSFGFKALGLNTALISYQMSNLFAPKLEHDSDPAILFFDADIKGMKPSVVKDKIEVIKSGTVIEFSEAVESESQLKEEGINYYLINRINQIASTNLKLQNEEIFQMTNQKKRAAIISPGHNSTFSGIATVLMGGFKPHVSIYEDLNLGQSVDTPMQRIFKKSPPENYISHLSNSRVECDGGAVVRTVDLSRSISHKYRSHDGLAGNLSPITNNNHISIKRLEEEINALLSLSQEKYNKLLLKVPLEFKSVIDEYLNQKKENFYTAIQTLIQDEVLPFMKNTNSAHSGIEMKVNPKTGLVNLKSK